MHRTNGMALRVGSRRPTEIRPEQLIGTIDQVKEHVPDAIGGKMSDNEETWKNVGEKFSTLGGRFKEHYQAAEPEAPDSEEVKEAFEKVTEGLERMFSSVGKAVRDDTVKADAKAAATSLIDAIGSTFEGLSEDIRKAVKRDSDAEAVTKSAEAGDPVADAADAAEEANQAVDDLRDDVTDG